MARLQAVVMIQPAGLGHPGGRPPLDGRGERLLDRLLGDVDVAEGPDQHRDGAAVLLTEDILDLRGGDGGHADPAQAPVPP